MNIVTNVLAGLVVVIGVAFGALMWAYDRRGDVLHGTEQSLKATHQAYTQSQERLEVTKLSLDGLAADRKRIVTVTKEVIREIPVYIPASTPALPGGFRVLHDSAATGVPLPDPTRQPPPAPVAAAAAAETVIDNYAACREQDAAYQRLQQWLTKGVKQ